MRKITLLLAGSLIFALASCGPNSPDTEREWDADRGVDLTNETGPVEKRDSASQDGEVRPERDTILNDR